MPLPGSFGTWSASQARRSAWSASGMASSRSESRASGPRMTSTPSPSWSATSATTRSLAVAVVARIGTLGGEGPEEPADAPVVGPEVVAPVGDAVGLVDDEQADRSRGSAAARRVTKRSLPRRSGEISRTSTASAASASSTAAHSSTLPEWIVCRAQPEPAGHRDLVAHQREQRADDERRAVALVAQDARRDPVDEALAPARSLDDERPAAVADDRLDRLALAFAELGVGAEHRLEVSLQGGVGRGHSRRAGLKPTLSRDWEGDDRQPVDPMKSVGLQVKSGRSFDIAIAAIIAS